MQYSSPSHKREPSRDLAETSRDSAPELAEGEGAPAFAPQVQCMATDEVPDTRPPLDEDARDTAMQGAFGHYADDVEVPQLGSANVHETAAAGVAGATTELPHADRIQASFGRHDVSGVKAHVGGRAAAASNAMGATAFAVGRDVGFGASPDVHTAAHEAAHVVQQRSGVQLRGGVGEPGDRYEQNADAVADKVVAAESAEGLLDSVASAGGATSTGNAVQHDKKKFAEMRARFERPAKRRPPPPPPRSTSLYGRIKPRSKKAPSIPTTTSEQIVIEEKPRGVEPETDQVETVEPEVKTTNQVAKQRIEDGQRGVDHLKRAIGQSKTAFLAPPEPEPEPESESKPAKKKGGGVLGKFFKNLFSGFTSKSSSSDMEDTLANLPTQLDDEPVVENQARNVSHDYDGAASELDQLKTKLAKNTGRLDTAIRTGKEIADGELTDAKNKVDGSAGELDGKVEQRHVSQLEDVGVGILDGSKAMLKVAFTRGGITYNSLRVGKNIGSGGSGAMVYRAKYLNMAPLAYKCFANGFLAQEGADITDDHEARREERIMGSFNHPNILRSGGNTDRSKKNAGYVMEMAENGDLDGVFKEMNHEATENKPDSDQKKLTTEDRLVVMRYLMRGGFRGLEQVHGDDGEGYVHGDIKHQNFLLGADLEPKLMDFGMTEAEEEDEDDRTKFVGTAGFMAPEVKTTGLVKKSDIWSMASTLLQGVFDKEVAGRVLGLEPNASTKKMPDLTGAQWLKYLTLQSDAVKGTSKFQDFVKKTMTDNPDSRMTAKAALGHEFLTLTKGDVTNAKLLLRQLLQGIGARKKK